MRTQCKLAAGSCYIYGSVQVVDLKWELGRQQHAVEDAAAARQLCQSQAEEMEHVYGQLHHLQQLKVGF